MRRVAIPLLVAALACGNGEEERAPAVEARYGEPFDLSLGERAVVDGGFDVTFTRVSEDSRCPEGAECVQAGNAAAAFAIESDEGQATLTLHTGREPREAAAMGGALSLVELRPSPVEGAPFDSAAYRATLIVDSAP
ncbi:MAG TPA: hypothetical protein VEY33_10880 [Gemmatimonadota bacterium]|nr:hypothetical protein [Gemmatimonadota bacterium]